MVEHSVYYVKGEKFFFPLVRTRIMNCDDDGDDDGSKKEKERRETETKRQTKRKGKKGELWLLA